MERSCCIRASLVGKELTSTFPLRPYDQSLVLVELSEKKGNTEISGNNTIKGQINY